MSSTAIPKVVPAQLSFLAIYNPSLGHTDETIHKQIVFYYSKAAKARSKLEGRNAQAEKELREHENEKLRQVGLAQGMVGFARSFSDGEAVDSAETHKSRIVLRELEEGWWILASIDLTQLPAHHSASSNTNGSTGSEPDVEYSSREVSPPALLIQQLCRAHNIFRLHHGARLTSLFGKYGRTRFCNILDKYWARFANNWDVVLHGSPAVDIYDGMKLAAGGELGMGVGEEEWGSGERLVLEDFVQKTDGLLDFMVSRFGEPSPLQVPKKPANSKDTSDPADLEPWLGGGRSAHSSDGVVFSGVGAISRPSLRDLSHWIESIYGYGDHAYGVRENPTSDRRKRRRRNPNPPPSDRASPEVAKPQNPPKTDENTSTPDSGLPPGIPPPIVKAVESSLDNASKAVDSTSGAKPSSTQPFLPSLGDTETWMKYLSLGYGTAWGNRRPPGGDRTPSHEPSGEAEQPSEAPMRYVDPQPDVDHAAEKLQSQIRQENAGYFILGLKGDLEEEEVVDDSDGSDWNNRIMLRTIHVELTGDLPDTPGVDGSETYPYERELSFTSSVSRRLSRLRPVIYVHRPFIYTFLFHHRTESLTLTSFYRNLHTYFSPLHRPLSNSTSPDRVAARISAASQPYTTTSSSKDSEANSQPIYDLVYDPRTLTVHSSIPNIPDPGTLVAEGLNSTSSMDGWSRLEALNVHYQILATVSSTRSTLAEIERTCKTSRGWWVVWMRLPPSKAEPSKDTETETGSESGEFDTDQLREAFLIRRARDGAGVVKSSSGSRFASGMWRPTGEKMGGAAAGWGPKGLAEGIGIDARRYVEGLLSLNR